MKARRVSQWRRTGWTLFVGAPLLYAFMGCASTRAHEYDGGGVEPVPYSDSITITVKNNRTKDAIDPHFYLVSSGKHPLGIVRGFGGVLKRRIPVEWIRSDGMIQVVVHYSGGRDLEYEPFAWRPGFQLDVSLDAIWNPTAAWSHR